MLYRALLILVTTLFVTMWTLLIRSELHPGENNLRAVPVEHVLREVFRNEKASQLIIRDGTQRIGSLRLAARPEEQDGSHALEFYGSLQLDLPGADPQRSAWSGDLSVTRDWQMRGFNLSVASRALGKTAGPPMQFELAVLPLQEKASYVVKSGHDVMQQQTFATNEAGLLSLLDQFGVDETWRKQLHLGHGPKPVITARQAWLTVDNVKLETYLLALVLNGQTLFEAHISQLGEVLQAHTLFGWTLDVR